nr:MDR family MFS transporter [uncultured Bacillus sp.]
MNNVLIERRPERQTNRPFVLASIMLAMYMGAIEGTIVSTAMPAIAGDLGDFSLYSWVFSAYLLMHTVTVLIYGKLSDLYGRKPVINVGITVFIIGSLLCGLAKSMTMLIVYRLVQGLGAGAVTSIATTIVGDIYSKEERARIQGYLSSVWGVSAILGPALGGILVSYGSWKFVFWLNIPLGLLAMAGITLFLHEKVEKKKHTIDYAGSIYLTILISALMIALVEGGTSWSWFSYQSLGLLLISVVVFLLFFLQEQKAIEPMMPFSIWRNRSIFIANITSLTTGIMLIGISSYLPAFVQGVMERSPIEAGFSLTTMSIGWPIASTIAGRLLLKIGVRSTSLLGGAALVIGSVIFVSLTPEAGPIWAAIGSFFVGVGMGLTSTAFIVLIQSTVSWSQRGIATASNSFMRNLGNTIAAAFLGGILNSRLKQYFQEQSVHISSDVSVDSVDILLNAEARNHLSKGMLELLQKGLTYSLHIVYYVVLLIAVISFILILFFPKEEKRK